MDKNTVALGKTSNTNVCITVDPASLEADERISLLEEQVKHMQRIISKLKKKRYGSKSTVTVENPNKDGLPIGTMCYGKTEKSAFLQYMEIEASGYRVGVSLYSSLSAAAEAVSGVRRSGWTFWNTLDGKTLKEVYRS